MSIWRPWIVVYASDEISINFDRIPPKVEPNEIQGI